MRKTVGTCLVSLLLLLAACDSGGAGNAPAPAEATATPAVIATEATTSTVDVGETENMTGTEGITETEDMTGLEGITETEGMTGMEGITETEGMTGTDNLTETDGVSGAGLMTDTMGITGTNGLTEAAGMTETAGMEQAPRHLIRASDLQDYNVENPAGENLGSVQDLVLNLDTGQILLVTLEYGGFLDIGDKVFPIPLSAFRFDQATAAVPAVPGTVLTDTIGMTDTTNVTDGAGVMTDSLVIGTRLILDIPEETFQNAPGVDENMDLTDPMTVGDIEGFYRDLGEDVIGRPIVETNLDELTGRVAKLSDLDGANVQNTNGDGVGEIDDMLLDLRTGRVEYFILSFGGFLGIGDNLYAVPVDAFDVIPTSADVEGGYPELVLDITEEQLNEAPVFDDAALTDPNWDLTSRDFWLQNQ